jgi:hypothetical protein
MTTTAVTVEISAETLDETITDVTALLRDTARCANPTATRQVFNAGYGPRAWCPGCDTWIAATEVPRGQESHSGGRIIAAYAPTPH